MTILNHLPKLRPHAFRVEGLKPHRHYHVRFDGVEDPEKRRGSFTTCASLAAPRRPQPGDDVDGCGGSLTAPYQKSFRGLCLSRDTPATDKTSAADGSALLSACREALDEAFAGTDCVFHLGGQVNLDAVQADAAGVLAQAENAYVRGDEARAGMLEDRAMQRLRDAYRTHWNLPGTREVLSRGGRVTVPGDADLGNTLLRNSTEGYVRRTLRRMTQRVYREYQRQLWEPLLPTAEAAVSYATAAVDSTTLRFGATHPWGATPGVAAEARRGCAPVSSHGEWHFHQWCGGAVGLFALDTKHERLYNEGACLIGEDQWAALDAALDAPGLRCAYVASDTPFVDRSFADAAALAASDPNFSHTWPARGDELLRLFQRLEDWEAGHAARRAFLLSGGTPCALQTELALRGAGNATAAALRAAAPAPAPPAQPRRQLLIHACGPVTAPSDKPDFELRGTLNADYTYAHTATKRQSVSIVMATWDAESAQMACAVVPPDGTRFYAVSFLLRRRPGPVRSHVDAVAATPNKINAGNKPTPPTGGLPPPRRPAWLRELVAHGGPTPKADESFEEEMLRGYLKVGPVRADLEAVFGDVGPGQDGPRHYAKKAFGPLSHYWHNYAPSQIRELCAPPSVLSIEAVAARWEKSGLADGFAGTTLALMDARAFVVFAGECFRFGLVVSGRVALSAAEASRVRFSS